VPNVSLLKPLGKALAETVISARLGVTRCHSADTQRRLGWSSQVTARLLTGDSLTVAAPCADLSAPDPNLSERIFV
jgi:hypothetical protein